MGHYIFPQGSPDHLGAGNIRLTADVIEGLKQVSRDIHESAHGRPHWFDIVIVYHLVLPGSIFHLDRQNTRERKRGFPSGVRNGSVFAPQQRQNASQRQPPPAHRQKRQKLERRISGNLPPAGNQVPCRPTKKWLCPASENYFLI
jgi:hypothetical protein